MVADIDAARDHVHVLFYIWLPDHNGRKMVAALMRAAARGVTCRAMADDLGSRVMIRSEHWGAMAAAGVRLARALPIGNPLLRPLVGRIDLRNHRKIVVIDDWITYCGSQNCADPAFLVKAKYAPWVDAMMRFQGPIARQNQHLFAADWMAHVDDDLNALLRAPLPTRPLGQSGADNDLRGIPAQVIGTGPTVRYSAMPELFEALIYSARRELIITTPYYVPDEPMQAALCASAWRGTQTSVVFPARNDSWIVAAASRSYYAELLAAGVRIYEYVGGLLHTKSLTLDGEVTLIGSANMDRRSFELNYENNILFYDPALTADVRQRQQSYIASFTSTLVGAAIKDGYIKSIDDKVSDYIPDLRGSVYDDVTIKQLLTMTSGVKWNEDYGDPKSDVALFNAHKAEPGVDVTVSYMRKLKREVPPGTKWVYKTGETNLIGVLVSSATGKNLSDYLSEKDLAAFWHGAGCELVAGIHWS
jgi:phosphatidylserine/phosphatidylglycerophosphate/cardiolipin synthase-like enzyme